MKRYAFIFTMTQLVILVLIVILVIYGAVVLDSDPVLDPVSAYEYLLPGSPKPTGKGCVPVYAEGTAYSPPRVFYCTWQVFDGVVVSVHIQGREDRVTRVQLNTNVRYGDVVNVLGRADEVKDCGRNTCYFWGDTVYAYGERTVLPSMQATIWMIVWTESRQ